MEDRIIDPDEFRLDPPLETGSWVTYDHVAIDGSRLVWTQTRGKPFRQAVWDKRLLERFIALDSEGHGTRALRRFARDNGPLGQGEAVKISAGEVGRFGLTEDVRLWTETAAEFASALRIYAHLKVNEPGSEADWVRLQPELLLADAHLAEQRYRLGCFINKRLRDTGACLRFTWLANEMPVIDFGGDTLIGRLTVQLALVVAGAESLFVCKGCQTPTPHRGRRTAKAYRFCRKCGP